MKDFSVWTIEYTDGKILQFHEKKFCHDGFINGGIYVMNRICLCRGISRKSLARKRMYLKRARNAADLFCMAFNEPFLDIGYLKNTGEQAQL